MLEHGDHVLISSYAMYHDDCNYFKIDVFHDWKEEKGIDCFITSFQSKRSAPMKNPFLYKLSYELTS